MVNLEILFFLALPHLMQSLIHDVAVHPLRDELVVLLAVKGNHSLVRAACFPFNVVESVLVCVGGRNTCTGSVLVL